MVRWGGVACTTAEFYGEGGCGYLWDMKASVDRKKAKQTKTKTARSTLHGAAMANF